MLRALCEQCGVPQPGDWQPGQLCQSCGSAVRREARCAWCVQWVPEATFCRGCGCQLVTNEQFGAARMLKDAGVDRFSLAGRLEEMDAEQVETLQAIFASQLVVLHRRVEEAELCEASLLQRGFAADVEDEWLPKLPLADDALAELGAGAEGPFVGRDDLLGVIFESSPLPRTRTLAALACVRRGEITPVTVQALSRALSSDDARVRSEAACAAAHWRMRGPGPGQLAGDWWQRVDRQALADAAAAIEGDRLRPWAAAAAVLNHGGTLEGARQHLEDVDGVAQALRDGAASRDRDLRLSCVLALADEELLRAELAGGDQEVRAVVAPALAALGSAASMRSLAARPPGEQVGVLRRLRAPVDRVMVEPLLTVVETGEPKPRRLAAWLLKGQLDDAMVDRIVAAATRFEDEDVFHPLLRAKVLPRAAHVVRAVFDVGHAERLREALEDTVEHGQLNAREVRQLLADLEEDVPTEVALRLAERLLKAGGDRELHRDVVRLMYDPARTVKTRAAACWVLRRWHKQARDRYPIFRLDTESVTWAFGDWPSFLEPLVAALGNHDLLKEVGVYESIADLFKYQRDDGLAAELGGVEVTELCEALLAVICGDYWLYLRTAAVELLGELLPLSDRADEQRNRVAEIAADDAVRSDIRFAIKRILE